MVGSGSDSAPQPRRTLRARSDDAAINAATGAVCFGLNVCATQRSKSYDLDFLDRARGWGPFRRRCCPGLDRQRSMGELNKGADRAARSRPNACTCGALQRTRDQPPAPSSSAVFPSSVEGRTAPYCHSNVQARWHHQHVDHRRELETVHVVAACSRPPPTLSVERSSGDAARIAAYVHDSYIAGEGTLHAAMLGQFTVAEVQGGGEIARGELMRYFAETAWYPTALLPSEGVRWTAVDDRSAKATLVDGSISSTLLFRFNDAGLIASVHADERGSGVGKGMVMLPWDCSVSNYQLRHGMMVPTRGEALKGGKPYFVGDLTSLVYEFAP